ncbi:hypothetical protein LCGC14_1195750, partial [marine sediment metagenome]
GISTEDLLLIKNQFYDLALGALIENHKVDFNQGVGKFEIIFKALLAINYNKAQGENQFLSEIFSLRELSSGTKLFLKNPANISFNTYSNTLKYSGKMHPNLVAHLEKLLLNLPDFQLKKDALTSIKNYESSRPPKKPSTWDPEINLLPFLRDFPLEIWHQYIYLYYFRRFLKSIPTISIQNKSFDPLSLIEAVYGEKRDYASGINGDWKSNNKPRLVELLIKQAGMIPSYNIRNEVQDATITDRISQHHILFDKISTDSIDLILLMKLHTMLTPLELFKPLEYSEIMRKFRDDFEKIMPFRHWNSDLKEKYNRQIKQIINEWKCNREIDLLGITAEWLSKFSGEVFKLRLLDGRIVGRVNYLNPNQLKNVITKHLSMEDFINYIIEHIENKINA